MTEPLKNHCATLRSDIFTQGLLAEWLDIKGPQISLKLPFAAKTEAERLIKSDPLLQGYRWDVQVAVESMAHSKGAGQPIAARNVIAVASGKGGVGKSSVCVNLALALSRAGAKVGILDADVYGPSLPTMLGNRDAKLTFTPNRKMLPLQRYGLQVNSLGYLVDAEDATVWRGPMASGALEQLYNDTQWQDLDYLLIDMPPGTGDIQLTLAQKLPLTGAVVVTTPQTVALADAQKGIAMFRKVDVPLLGIIENMSYFQCGECGHQDPVFGQQGGADVARKHSVPLLGQWPLLTELRQSMDDGTPLVYDKPNHSYSDLIMQSAQQMAGNLYEFLGPEPAQE
ncbi:iron-sulfur cluster carrier protein ApbC [Aliidiomarina minuta]|uniref:Iron-sulfur cluster carrier protein n=1 Tax=Aliidiomarina minuta TaxID=880057 RepID=A0A432W6R9_9GAMM|nr:iron-sulfur cluster carrier protein ApbC [Aliidiomarina minuta]RUO25770.1 iron-sulfur cluster carrier protein ApbC [Aliidiomarina minuta]